jgi:hypothetical protein
MSLSPRRGGKTGIAVAVSAVVVVLSTVLAGTSRTDVALTILVPSWVPEISTWSPDTTALKDGELVPGSFMVAVVDTPTVTRVVVELPGLVTSIVKVVGSVVPGAVTTVPSRAPRPCPKREPHPVLHPGDPPPPRWLPETGAALATAALPSDRAPAKHTASPAERT